MSVAVAESQGDVPILGQRLNILNCTLIALGQCQCGHANALQLIAQFGEQGQTRLAAVCPSCHYSYSLLAMLTDQQGKTIFNVDMAPPDRES